MEVCEVINEGVDCTTEERESLTRGNGEGNERYSGKWNAKVIGLNLLVRCKARIYMRLLNISLSKKGRRNCVFPQYLVLIQTALYIAHP